MADESVSVEAASMDEQADQQQVRLRVNDREMITCYANAFRSNASADEVFLDFGVNMVTNRTGRAGNGEEGGKEVQFDVSSRVIMNYVTAKRLAMLLGKMLRDHEQRFGEVELNVAERAKHANGHA